jgi:hypothetical protein
MLAVAAVWIAGVVDDAGVQRPPGLRMSSTVAVPSLNIPASRVEVIVAGSNGVVQPNITMQWTNSISPVRFVNLTGVTLTIAQGAGSVSGSVQLSGTCSALPCRAHECGYCCDLLLAEGCTCCNRVSGVLLM